MISACLQFLTSFNKDLFLERALGTRFNLHPILRFPSILVPHHLKLQVNWRFVRKLIHSVLTMSTVVGQRLLFSIWWKFATLSTWFQYISSLELIRMWLMIMSWSWVLFKSRFLMIFVKSSLVREITERQFF